MSAVTPRVLFIDAYDSFSNNIISLLESKIPRVKVTTIKIDDFIPDFPQYLGHFDAVVAGPGPGHPENGRDVGLISELWRLNDANVLPVLGICLGFQSLVAAYGGIIKRLPAPRHGIVRRVTHYDSFIFKDVGYIAPVQYHSLFAEIGPGTEASKTAFMLQPLAWDLKEDNGNSAQITEHESNPYKILMAVKHKERPFYGIQFHPESVCSDEGCQRIVENWWLTAQKWNKQRGFRHVVGANGILSNDSTPKHNAQDTNALQSRLLLPSMASTASSSTLGLLNTSNTRGLAGGCRQVVSRCLPLNGLSVPQICELLRAGDQDVVVLDAEPHQRPDVGTYSIIGAIGPDTLRLEHSIGDGKMTIRQRKDNYVLDFTRLEDGVFDYLKHYMHSRRTTGGSPDIPFWGGLIGYISYEACLETIDIRTSSITDRSDIGFLFVERSVVIDHQRRQIHVQTIKAGNDDQWVERICSRLATFPTQPSDTTVPELDPVITYPDQPSYNGKIRKCQEDIHNGESYELCLTNQVTIKTNHLTNPWPLYLRLRSLNAAPFSAYMRIGGMTLLSSSPERFMRWSRPTSSEVSMEETRSTVQFRPIKGTVKRHPHGLNNPAITLEQATALLATPKERAENLMIVDLIRHDLHGVVGSGNVCVPKLMVVEEYATLFQLVTVIEGTLINHSQNLSNPPSLTTSSHSSPYSSRPITPSSSARSESPAHYHPWLPPPPAKPIIPKNGIDVLAASLPPGSMTGAPKRRSCALLRGIEENKPRSIYSGVVGYIDVGGGGDFSVVIRSAFRWDNDTMEQPNGQGKRDTWNVGAGGAITSLSTEEGEWEEMIAKLGSTLRMFE